MKSPIFFDSQGHPVSLGLCLGRGGEGAVYSVAGDDSLAAKIYTRRPDDTTLRKLRAMVATGTPALRDTCAWPVDLLFGQRREPLGFLMPAVRDHHEIHTLYGPADRRCTFPDATWAFLVRAARNLAIAFETVHARGHVVGDINQANAVVSQCAMVRLIDCDSFQISHDGEVFRCRVGVPLFTPPELQGCHFDDVARTRDHDAFGLAVLVFHLLFLGRHPFAGRHPGRALALDEAIRERAFVYGRTAGIRGWAPPPFALRLEEVTPELAGFFESALGAGARRGGNRPTAQQWALALDAMEAGIVRCAVDARHLFLPTAAGCPWCRIEREGGPQFFRGPGEDPSRDPRRVAEGLWQGVRAVPEPGPPPPIPPLPATLSTRPPLAKRLPYYTIARVLGVVASLILVFILYRVGLGPGVLVLVPVILLAGRSSCDNRAEKERLHGVVAQHEAAVRRVEGHWKSACDDFAFQRRKSALARIRWELDEVDRVRRDAQKAMPAALASACISRYLEQVVISEHDVPGLEPDDFFVLELLGIRTADRLYSMFLSGYPALTDGIRQRLFAWRRRVEEEFPLSDRRRLTESQKRILKEALGEAEQTLLESLRRGIDELKADRDAVIARRAAIAAEMEKAQRALTEAKADLEQAFAWAG